MSAENLNNPVQEQTPKVKKVYKYPPEKIREYNKRMYEKNKLKERYECPICYGVYTHYNKSHHTHSDLHMRAIKYLETQKELKMNPPTLDKQINETIVYSSEDEENKSKDLEINLEKK